MRRIVLDTSVVVAAVRSRLGASHRLLSLVGEEHFEVVLSVPLALEYEDVLTRNVHQLVYSADELLEILDFVCAHARPQPIYYLWRPILRDANDDHVLEVAVAGRADTIVTFNVRDFREAPQFAVRALTPGAFLREIAS